MAYALPPISRRAYEQLGRMVESIIEGRHASGTVCIGDLQVSLLEVRLAEAARTIAKQKQGSYPEPEGEGS